MQRYKDLPVVLLITTNFGFDGYGYSLARYFSKFTNTFVYSTKHYFDFSHYAHMIPSVVSTNNDIFVKFLGKMSYIFNSPHKVRFTLLRPEDVDLLVVVDPVICRIDIKPFSKATKVYWAQDTHAKKHRNIHFYSTHLEDYDLIYVAHSKDLDKYREVVKREVMHLPYAFDPEVYRPLNSIEKEYDISFVGTITPQRLQFLRDLAKKPNIRSFIGNAYLKDVNTIYNKSKIVINISQSNELNWRVFEVLGSGSFLLSNATEEISEVFKPSYHLDTFENENELVYKIFFYLQNENIRNQIAVNGNEEALRKHTLENRAVRILKDAHLIQ